MLQFSIVKGEDDYRIEGIYTNIQSYMEIQVDLNRKGMSIRGLDRRYPNRWTKFRQIYRDVYADRNGNEVKLKGVNRYGDTRLLIRDRRGRVDVFTRGIIHHRNRTTCTTIIDYNHEWDDHRYQDNPYFDRRKQRRSDIDNDYYDNRRYEDNRQSDYNRSSSLEGTYKTNDGRFIAILETRDGFKAKFKGERNWKNYIRQGDRFVDNDGNQYTTSRAGELNWQGKYSKKNILITKVGDEVAF